MCYTVRRGDDGLQFVVQIQKSWEWLRKWERIRTAFNGWCLQTPDSHDIEDRCNGVWESWWFSPDTAYKAHNMLMILGLSQIDPDDMDKAPTPPSWTILPPRDYYIQQDSDSGCYGYRIHFRGPDHIRADRGVCEVFRYLVRELYLELRVGQEAGRGWCLVELPYRPSTEKYTLPSIVNYLRTLGFEPKLYPGTSAIIENDKPVTAPLPVEEPDAEE